MRDPVSFIPILTTLVAVPFALMVFRRWRERGGAHLLWWSAGILLYGVGTLTEALTTLAGWHEPICRAWYISGALLGAAPLAQGTVYLLFSRRTAHRMTAILVPFILLAAICVLLSPIDVASVQPYHLTGRVLEWRWVRFFSPFVNTYSAIFLIGGAIFSALKFSRDESTRHRAIGNVLIATGAILPGIGGTATRMGHTEVLYVTELIGILFILAGYRTVVGGPRRAFSPATVSTARSG